MLNYNLLALDQNSDQTPSSPGIYQNKNLEENNLFLGENKIY